MNNTIDDLIVEYDEYQARERTKGRALWALTLIGLVALYFFW